MVVIKIINFYAMLSMLLLILVPTLQDNNLLYVG